jgi:hypothetical protein
MPGGFSTAPVARRRRDNDKDNAGGRAPAITQSASEGLMLSKGLTPPPVTSHGHCANSPGGLAISRIITGYFVKFIQPGINWLFNER